MGWIDDALEDVAEDVIELLVKTLISGLTLTFSAPVIAAATVFNNSVGRVDPLLLPPIEVGFDRPDIWNIRGDAINAFNKRPAKTIAGIITAEKKRPTSVHLSGVVKPGSDRPA